MFAGGDSSCVGICCGTDGAVIALFLQTNQLEGTLPPLLWSGLPELQVGYAYENQGLGGSLPTQLGRATALLQLYTHMTSMSGSLPTQLARLTVLQVFNMTGTLLTYPADARAILAFEVATVNCEGEPTACCTLRTKRPKRTQTKAAPMPILSSL